MFNVLYKLEKVFCKIMEIITYCYEFVNIVCKICKYYLFCIITSQTHLKYSFFAKNVAKNDAKLLQALSLQRKSKIQILC